MANLETTAKERVAYVKAAETEFVWPDAGFVGRLLRDFDRLSVEIASLKAKLAEAEAVLEPFALVAEHDIGADEHNDDQFRPMTGGKNSVPLITVGDLRRALAILARGGSDD